MRTRTCAHALTLAHARTDTRARAGCSSIDLASGLVFAVNLLVSFQVRRRHWLVPPLLATNAHQHCAHLSARAAANTLLVSRRRISCRAVPFPRAQIGFVLEHGHKKRLLMDGRHVARFYVLRAGFFIDVAAVLPVVYQASVMRAGGASGRTTACCCCCVLTCSRRPLRCAGACLQIIMLIFHIENYWCEACASMPLRKHAKQHAQACQAACQATQLGMLLLRRHYSGPAAALPQGQPLHDVHDAAAPCAAGGPHEAALC